MLKRVVDVITENDVMKLLGKYVENFPDNITNEGIEINWWFGEEDGPVFHFIFDTEDGKRWHIELVHKGEWICRYCDIQNIEDIP